MAATSPAPAHSDLVTVEEAVELFRETPHPVSVTTLKRWIRKHRLSVTPEPWPGRANRVSYSDLLEVHRDEIGRREQAAG
ncbi:helix-turn-helix domain-containing protein [Streptomyces scabiei]|uniref:helix-turn-helix domain-containing protein n=1 Tax=Streptomyces scabiei TaxID=1930 RepID=UPI00076616BF|nr:helix-turn-helix domain-containing protein [Streptomyces scabiei]MDX2658316.1 helix-turn-helix domain-containing protein [Streptomyces scabiei]MDX2870601.1 helix-turn-helix domain-containing protein [Streptomyces scabiei]MDX2999693.1 helix-turn-helix domain-containing protein [Streptomyces scabiei]MDX3053114.1 helix-turn-helix domain-containing protein [Streptomyces scabiei]MDX3175282.1 helix-turn-helix domain-containing protein [Streptomyces scabiei]